MIVERVFRTTSRIFLHSNKYISLTVGRYNKYISIEREQVFPGFPHSQQLMFKFGAREGTK